MLELASIVVLAAHLLLVDLAMAGPFICVWLEWREARRGDLAAGHIGRNLARYCLHALTLAVVLGAALLGLMWFSGERRYFLELQLLPQPRLWYALFELLFYFACMVAYLFLWRRGPRWFHRTLAVVAGTNLMYHFPPLFTILYTLRTRPALFDRPIDRSMFQQLLLDPEVMSRVIHVWLAAIAVSAVVVVIESVRAARHENDRPAALRISMSAARLALLATALQLPVGMWVFFELPTIARESLMGRDWIGTAMFAVSLVGALRLMHYLASLALGDVDFKQVRGAVIMMVAVVTLMAGTLYRAQENAQVRRKETLSFGTDPPRSQEISTHDAPSDHARR